MGVQHFVHLELTYNRMVNFSKIASSLFLLFSTTSAYRRNAYWQQMYNDRRNAQIGYHGLLDHLAESKIIIDTRTAAEREEFDAESLALPTDAHYIIVDYDNFWKADRFFASFEKESEWYNSDNDGHDIDIFDLPENFSFKKPLNLPQEIVDMGSDITLLCGRRSCGCRWGLMWTHGFRGMKYYASDVNNFIKDFEDDNW